MAIKQTKQDMAWQAEDDARTMARYEEIISDRARMGRAVKAAQTQANELNKRVSVMTKVASTGKKTSKKK